MDIYNASLFIFVLASLGVRATLIKACFLEV